MVDAERREAREADERRVPELEQRTQTAENQIAAEQVRGVFLNRYLSFLRLSLSRKLRMAPSPDPDARFPSPHRDRSTSSSRRRYGSSRPPNR